MRLALFPCGLALLATSIPTIRAAHSTTFADSLCRNGDIVFQRGRGLIPRLLPILLQERDGFSHVGVVVVRGGTAYVAHAEPADRGGGGRSRLERLSAFLDPSRTRRLALYRLAGDHAGAAERAAFAAASLAAAGHPFDWDFDRSRPDRLYCTELVWRAYREAGFSLVRDRNLVQCRWGGRRRHVIAPGSLLKSGKLVLVAHWGEDTPKTQSSR